MSYKKFTKDIGLLGLAQIIAAISGILTLPVITKLLGAENYGIWTQLMVTIGVIMPVALLGLPYTLVIFLAGKKNEEEIQDGIWSVFTIIFGASLIISSLLLIFSNPISHFFSCPRIFVQILAVVIIFDYLNLVLSHVFRMFQQIKEYCFFGIFQTLGETLLIILSVVLGYGLFGAILSFLIIRILAFLAMGTLVIKRVGIRIPRFLRIKEYLSFSLPTIPGDISSWVIQSSDKYLIGFFLGTLFVGYYAPAYTLGSCLAFFIAPLSFILPAKLSEHHNTNEIDEVKNYLKHSLKYFLAVAIPSFFGLSILSKQILTIFSTTEIANNSYGIVPLVAFSTLISGAYVVIAQALSLKKKTSISGLIWVAAALLNLGGNFIFIPRFGIMGAAITTLLAYALAFALTWYFSLKAIKFEVEWNFIVKSALASIIMASFIFLFNPLGWLRTFIAIVIGAGLYFFLMVLLKGFEKKELTLLRGIFTREN